MAMVDATSFDALLKEYYSDEYVRDTTYEDNTWFAMIPKLTTLTGDPYVQPVQYGHSVSRSHVIAKVLANKDTNKYIKFAVDTVDDYAAISIGRKIMKQSGNNRGAFFEARTREIDGMLKSLVRSCAIKQYRDSGGSLGQVHASTAPSGTTLTLADPEDSTNYEVGMELVFSDNDGTTSTDALHAGSATITAVDRDAGTLTTDVAWTTQVPALGTSDYIFADGDFKVSISGLADWIPTTAPTSGDSFHGVDRSVDVSRLAGTRISAVGDPIRDALRQMCSRLGREGASPDMALMTHQKFNDLITELDNKVEYNTTNVTANVGFTGVRIVGNKKPLTVYADQNCPDSLCYVLTKDTWKFISYGPVPDLHDEDGLRILREATADGFEVRASYYGNEVCCDPRGNGVLTLE